jgi:hypothetical protein
MWLVTYLVEGRLSRLLLLRCCLPRLWPLRIRRPIIWLAIGCPLAVHGCGGDGCYSWHVCMLLMPAPWLQPPHNRLPLLLLLLPRSPRCCAA